MPATVRLNEDNGAVVFSNGVQSVTVTAGGSGYTSAPTVAFTGTNTTAATAVAYVSGGVVTHVVVTNPGAGYTADPTVAFSGGGGTGATATASAQSGTRTANPANVNMGSVDAAALDPTANPLPATGQSFEKWHKIEVTGMGTSTKIDNLKVWASAALEVGATHNTNARTSTYGGQPIYAAPTNAASTIATQVMPTATPASANLGIGGVLTGALAAVGSSDYLVSQIATSGASAGKTVTMNYQYDETA